MMLPFSGLLAQANSVVALPLASHVAHCVVFSPPYWGHRDYRGAGGEQFPEVQFARTAGNPTMWLAPWQGDYGQEPQVDWYVGHTVALMREVARVLRPEGVVWLNMGDTFAGAKGDLPQGSKMNVPGRIWLALMADGWTVRMDLIWCLSGGSILYAKTAKGVGPKTLKDLVRLKPATVQLWNGSRWTQVLGWRRQSRPQPLEIELRSGEKISCSPSHEWPTQRGLVHADQLRAADIIEQAPLPDSALEPAWLTDDACWFAGLFLAEGNYAADGGLSLSGNAAEENRWKRIQALAEHYGATCRLFLRGNNQKIDLDRCESLKAVLSQLLRGRTSKDKGLSPDAWNMSNRLLRLVVEGYLEGDGHWDGRRWRLGFTRNHKLASDLRCLAARLGSTLTLKQTFSSFAGRRYPSFRGEWRWHRSPRMPRNEVVAVRRPSGARVLWDVAVADEPHLFCLASGLLTHNSKPNPMPDPANGWRWERHRIKVRKAVENWREHARDKDGIVDGAVAHVAGGNYGFTHKPEWAECSGCATCEPNDGYVLRKGSWRHTVAHEVVLQCTQGMQYWSDAEIVAEQASPEAWGASHGTYSGQDTKDYDHEGAQSPSGVRRIIESASETRNPRSVAPIPTANYPGQHTATFPPDLIRPLILSSCPRRACSICGIGWAPVVERTKHASRDMEAQRAADAELTGRTDGHISGPSGETDMTHVSSYRPACEHVDAPPVPGLVVDPFCGSGTTGQVAREAGLRFIGLDLSLQYLSEQARVRVLRGMPPRALDDLPLFGGA